MPWTNFPNGVSCTTQTGSVSGTLICTSVSAVGISATSIDATALTGANGGIYGGRVAFAFAGSASPSVYQAALTSALYDSGATLRCPFQAVPEIVWATGGTANITGLITVHAGSVSTAAVVATLTVGSATSAASSIYTTFGGTAIGQGSFIHISSAVQATANSSEIMVNLVPTA